MSEHKSGLVMRNQGAGHGQGQKNWFSKMLLKKSPFLSVSENL